MLLFQTDAPGTAEFCYVNILLFRSPGVHTRQLMHFLEAL
jgi:hypothetical protein